MDRSITTGLADSQSHSRPLGRVAAFMTASIVVLLVVAGVFPVAASAGLVKGLVDPPAWSEGEAVQFVPAPPGVAAGAAAAPAFTPGGSEVSGEPLEYHKEAEGKGVEHTPKVYVILWGKNFETLTTGKETQAKLETLFKGFESSSYQGILTQYFDTLSHVGSKVTVTFLADASVGAAPTNVGTRTVRAEAEKYRAKYESTENLENADFMVVAAPGSTYESGFEPEGEGFCSYHGLDNSVGKYAYSFVPYEGDKPFPEKKCLESDGSENAVHETSRFASAAYADTVTDPRMNAWKTKAGHEIDYGPIAAPCAKELDLELPTGAWAQNLFDDHLLGCKHSDASPPSVYVVTQPTTAINPTEGTLTAVVNPENLTTKYWFQWGLTNSYGNTTTPVGTLNPSIENSSVTATLQKLNPETTYHYRIFAENSTGSTYGYDGTFTTLKAEPPYALTEPATGVEETAATLNGTINPKMLSTKFFFEWGETETYVNKTKENTGTGSSNIPLHETLTGLHALHEYHYRIKAESAGGIEPGLDKAFVTPGWISRPAQYGGVSLSCPAASPGTCMATGGNSESETRFWNGTSWQKELVPVPDGYNGGEIVNVSCWSANGCFGYGRITEQALVEGKYEDVDYLAIWLWNGTQWSFQTKLSNYHVQSNPFDSGPISCTSATFCQAIFVPIYTNELESYVWNGASWVESPMALPGGGTWAEARALSCGSTALCEAAGYTNAGGGERFIDSWNGSDWSLSKTVGAEVQNWLGLSCLPEECLIVGTRAGTGHESGGIELRSAGGVFTEKEVPLPGGANEHSLKPVGISCVARETCVLAGDYVKTSTGHDEVLVDQQSPQHEGGAWYSAQLPAFERSLTGTSENEASCWSALGCAVVDSAKEGPELRLVDSPVPANTKLPAITPAAPEPGVAEAVSNGSWVHEPTTYSYQWELCNSSGAECTAIAGQTNTSYTPTELNGGHALRAKVFATNSIGTEFVYTAPTQAVKTPPPPVNTQLPVVSPSTPEVGSLAATTNGTWNREIAAYTYQWELCNASGGECASITGATSSNYTPVEANLGHTLRAKVTAKNTGGSTAATSAASNPVAAAGSSHITQSIEANALEAVSCVPSTTDCVVSDSKGNAYYATNVKVNASATWSAWAGPSTSASEALACPATSLCLIADGGDVYYASSLGGTWTNAFSPSYGVDSISCGSSSFCIDGQSGNGGFIRYSASPASTTWTAEKIAESTNVTGVFCLSSSFCTAVNSTGDVYIATTTSQIESEKWTKTDIDGTTALNGIACTSTTSCIAVDGVGDVLNLTIESSGAAKVTTNHLDGTNSLTAVTCSGATCVAVDNVGNVFESTNSGSAWSKAYALSDDLTSVSCASTTLCLTADTTGHITAFRPA